MFEVDQVLNDYAHELERACEAGTMNGYHSYLGFLAKFARDFDFAKSGCESNCIPSDFNMKPNARHKLDCPVWRVLGVGG